MLKLQSLDGVQEFFCINIGTRTQGAASMRPAEIVTLASSLFLVLVGCVQRISPRQMRPIAGLALLCAALIFATQALAVRLPQSAAVVGDWLPCLLILLVYWQAGNFFADHSESLQGWLQEFDRRRLGTLLEDWSKHWSRTWLGSYFELAYLFCYLMIPAGVGILYWAHQRAAINVYWALVLPASYLCYLVIPFAQTLPPRLLDGTLPAPSSSQKIRAFNLLIMRHASIHLNTFPSGHVAATMAAALVLLRYVPAAGALFLFMAVSIAIGAVLGRYHYVLDVILGAALPFGVFGVLGWLGIR
jgi:membrane-associated phospholipid phosphatase